MTQTGFSPPPFVPPPPAGKPAQPQQTNVRETVESILVAFILAFIFRAFVVEAFVIPTGSMAPTLLGAHMRFYCPECGFKFTANYSSPQSDGDDVFVPNYAEPALVPTGRSFQNSNGDRVAEKRPETRVYPIHCLNCGYKLPKVDLNNPENDGTSPAVHHGDRILVMKYLYLFQDPARWDVVVFKSPESPDKYDYTQNYIKRLVGRPNEVIMILDGDIYAAPNTGAEPKTEDFKVQTKPDGVQNALWRVVYDNDFHQRRSPSGNRREPWTLTTGAGWDPSGDNGRTFRFDNATGAATLRFDPGVIPETFPLKDFLGYDQTWFGSPKILEDKGDIWSTPLMPPRNVVADLRLSVTYERKSGDGPLRMRLSKLGDVFTAELLPGKVRLLRSADGGPEVVVGEAPATWDRPTRVELQNVDYRASVRVDGTEVLATGADYAPDVAALRDANPARPRPLPTVEIVADRQACAVSHVGLHRDIFYISDSSYPWGSSQRPIALGPDEYFVCGDNSLISGDARTWRTPINLPDEELIVESGRVPGRFLLGKAFFIYWPAGYRPLPSLPGLAPNFGEMRFIH